ncbi:hypothetical protein BDQ17DRAFT_1480913 [Cyathus striatus]|nr:hypothetical protein BDQ17DRAFT_1480913 [Cyathus striatus]
MPSLTVKHGLTYFYTDNGAPNAQNYKTMIIIHGHTFHSGEFRYVTAYIIYNSCTGAFQRLNPVATAKGLRLICLNRREYAGSTSFTQEEIKTLNDGSETERENLLAQQGVEYALFVDGIIKECELPKEGGVIIAGWSLGNLFLLSILASISSLPSEVQERLTTHLTRAILWDPPSQVIGVKNPEGAYHPLWDMNLAPEARGQVFGVWCASYWKHGDLSARDMNQLKQREPETTKTATILRMSPEELGAITDFAPGGKWETAVCEPYYHDILMRLTKKAIYSPPIRAAWNKLSVWNMYGDANTWNVIYAVWVLEDLQKESNAKEPLINFKLVEGANHFFMWDEPERAMDCLQQCVEV